MTNIPLRIIELDGYLVDLKRVQVVSPLDKDRFSLTMVSGIDVKCSDASMYKSVKQAYRDYMKWEQWLDTPSVTTVNTVGEVKPECVINCTELSENYRLYYVGQWNLANVFMDGLGKFVVSFNFNLEVCDIIGLLQTRYSTIDEADKVARDNIERQYNRLFA